MNRVWTNCEHYEQYEQSMNILGTFCKLFVNKIWTKYEPNVCSTLKFERTRLACGEQHARQGRCERRFSLLLSYLNKRERNKLLLCFFLFLTLLCFFLFLALLYFSFFVFFLSLFFLCPSFLFSFFCHGFCWELAFLFFLFLRSVPTQRMGGTFRDLF